MGGKVVFVTVGTTKFDTLIHTITQGDTLHALLNQGYNDLIIQTGNGTVIPDAENAKQANINLSHYKYKNSIQDDISKADLVISHAGAGTCLEVLAQKKPLLVVVNEELMHNHQTELAEALSSEGYLFACTCTTLPDVINKISISKLKKMPPPESGLFANYLDKFMGLEQ